MIKSFLEPQVLFTVGLTAGASLVKQLSQDGGNHLFYSACFLKTGRDKSLNSKSSGPRIFSIPRKGMQYHAATRWEAWKKKSCMPDSVPPPYSPFMLPELETATKIRPNSMRSGRDRTSSKTQWDFMCKQEASWWRELLPCQRSLLSLPHPRLPLKRESTFSCLTLWRKRRYLSQHRILCKPCSQLIAKTAHYETITPYSPVSQRRKILPNSLERLQSYNNIIFSQPGRFRSVCLEWNSLQAFCI